MHDEDSGTQDSGGIDVIFWHSERRYEKRRGCPSVRRETREWVGMMRRSGLEGLVHDDPQK
jgi:hypothetical protein